MAKKIFKLSADEIVSFVPGYGGCIASDRITVDGAPVGYMYRDAPFRPEDSGWCFLAGDEDEAYMADETKHEVYDVNTIANYDPDIVPFLDAEEGSHFARDEDGIFQPVEEDDEEEGDD
ncbi:hypothetical protein GCM10007301_26060 [Azorhizobium oxalatiphilum]|uniref:Immunity protein Imm33 domain-containing protein n=1 Tax=Azorhizobium oxalatiphilum TaxID=980631 RepID=A0A917C186_9HYPH|nr:DUF2185 domain-containing protein [Azorhizobium oxalatiphilum]GGF65036.1 hypothetical protein GCM10007301_26060 [Azorhizobium oxalatiphilum]